MESRALLRLMAWLSPGFPTGAYAYSHGLEWAVAAGDIADPETLLAWLSDLLRHGSGRNDAILLRQAYRAASEPGRLVEIARTRGRFRAIARTPRRNARHRASFCRRRRGVVARNCLTEIAYPVAVGVLAAGHDIPEDDAALGYLQAFAANLISAAVRLIPLGQSAGLRVLAAIEPAILEVAAATRERGSR